MQLRSPTFAFDFLYDASGHAVGMWYENANGARSRYFYERNLQGDIVAIVNNLGEIRATYAYDAWGNCTVTNTPGYGVGTANPIRYRGYYQDTETGFYFLQTRYYDPEVKRFINADSLFVAEDVITGANMYAYCDGNPVMLSDPSGMASGWAVIGQVLSIVFAPFVFLIDVLGITDSNVAEKLFEDWVYIAQTIYGESSNSQDGQWAVAYTMVNRKRTDPSKSFIDIIKAGYTGRRVYFDHEEAGTIDTENMLSSLMISALMLAGAYFIIDGYASFLGLVKGCDQMRSKSYFNDHFTPDEGSTTTGTWYDGKKIIGVTRIGGNVFFKFA